MKKVLLGLGLVISGSLMAQKPMSDASHFSLEGLINYNANDGMNWTAPSLRLRYFVNDNIAARVQFGFGDGSPTPSKESYTFYENMDGTGAKGTVDINRGSWNSQIGAEYHLTGNDKMSPYFFGGVLFGKGSYEESWASASDLATGDYEYDATIKSAGIKAGSGSFGWTLGAGLDYYLADNLYVGLEMGLQSSSVNYTDVETTVTFADNTSMNFVDGPAKMSYTSLGAAHGSIRIGWRF